MVRVSVRPPARRRSRRPVAGVANDRPNVLLVTLDTTRADHLGCYGYARPTSPHLDAMAAESTIYTRAISSGDVDVAVARVALHGEVSDESWCALRPDRFLGAGERDPGSTDAQRVPRARRRADRTTLAAVLGRAGYRTGGVAGGPVAEEGLRPRNRVRVVGRRRHRQHQWSHCRRSERPRPAVARHRDGAVLPLPQLLRCARSVLRPRRGSPSRSCLPRSLPGSGRRSNRRKRSTTARSATPTRTFGDVVAALKRRNLYDRTWIIVTADHGELFGEHGLKGHGTAPVSGGHPRAVREQTAARRRRASASGRIGFS